MEMPVCVAAQKIKYHPELLRVGIDVSLDCGSLRRLIALRHGERDEHEGPGQIPCRVDGARRVVRGLRRQDVLLMVCGPTPTVPMRLPVTTRSA